MATCIATWSSDFDKHWFPYVWWTTITKCGQQVHFFKRKNREYSSLQVARAIIPWAVSNLGQGDSYLNKIWEILFQKYWGRYYQVVKRLLQKLLSPPREHNHKTWATGTSAQGEYREFGSIVASDAFVTWSRFGKYLWFGKIRSKYIYRNLGPWLLNLGSKYHSWKKISGGKRDSMKINPWWKFFFAFWIFFSTLIKDLIVKN